MISRRLSWAPLVAIGTASYSLYLWHYPIFMLLSDGGVIDGSPMLRTSLKLVLTAGATILSFWFLERPTMRAHVFRPRLAPRAFTRHSCNPADHRLVTGLR